MPRSTRSRSPCSPRRRYTRRRSASSYREHAPITRCTTSNHWSSTVSTSQPPMMTARVVSAIISSSIQRSVSRLLRLGLFPSSGVAGMVMKISLTHCPVQYDFLLYPRTFHISFPRGFLSDCPSSSPSLSSYLCIYHSSL